MSISDERIAEIEGFVCKWPERGHWHTDMLTYGEILSLISRLRAAEERAIEAIGFASDFNSICHDLLHAAALDGPERESATTKAAIRWHAATNAADSMFTRALSKGD